MKLISFWCDINNLVYIRLKKCARARLQVFRMKRRNWYQGSQVNKNMYFSKVNHQQNSLKNETINPLWVFSLNKICNEITERTLAIDSWLFPTHERFIWTACIYCMEMTIFIIDIDATCKLSVVTGTKRRYFYVRNKRKKKSHDIDTCTSFFGLRCVNKLIKRVELCDFFYAYKHSLYFHY